MFIYIELVDCVSRPGVIVVRNNTGLERTSSLPTEKGKFTHETMIFPYSADTQLAFYHQGEEEAFLVLETPPKEMYMHCEEGLTFRIGSMHLVSESEYDEDRMRAKVIDVLKEKVRRLTLTIESTMNILRS